MNEIAQQVTAESKAGQDRWTMKAFFSQDRSIWMIALVLAIFFSTQSQFFFTAYNISNVLTQATLIGFLALGLTPVIITGNIDLSVSSVTALTACIAILLQPYGPLVALGVAMGAGIGMGALNGIIVEKLGVNSFIATLATMTGIRGLTFLIVGDVSLAASDLTYNIVATTPIIGPVNTVVFVFGAAALILAVVLRRTAFGRNIYAIGGNREAAVDAGIPVTKVVISSFVTSGVLSAVSGIAMAAKLGAAAPSYATGYELIAIATVILGGTRLEGGYGYIVGTLGAVLTLAILRNGLSLLGTSPFIIPIIVGSVLILALILDRQLRRGMAVGIEN